MAVQSLLAKYVFEDKSLSNKRDDKTIFYEKLVVNIWVSLCLWELERFCDGNCDHYFFFFFFEGLVVNIFVDSKF